MSWEEDLAFQYAPVVLQKVHPRYARADYITNVDFAYGWTGLDRNWAAVWEKTGARYTHSLKAHAYFSVVATFTHFFIVYAFYHPQDWAHFHGNPASSKPTDIDQHLHDMEGCLVIVPKKDDVTGRGVVAFLTISHWHFYSYGGWEKEVQASLPFRVGSWEESVDGPILLTSRFARGRNEPEHRFKLFVQSGGHGIKGSRDGWGGGKRVVRYRPTLGAPEAPRDGGFVKDEDIEVQPVRYQLVSIFRPGGLWAHREDERVLQTNDKGQDAFVIARDGARVPGSAKPPWGWDDCNDAHKPGDFAWDPAHLVSGYFGGLREFSREYMHNRYLGVVME